MPETVGETSAAVAPTSEERTRLEKLSSKEAYDAFLPAARAVAVNTLQECKADAVLVHDTVTLLVGFHPIRFAITWYLYFLNEHGVTLPFWVTGLVILGTLATAVVLVARRRPAPDELVRWLALVLLVANLVNKQAFYNQYWLSAALVALSLVAPSQPLEDEPVSGSAPPPVPATAR